MAPYTVPVAFRPNYLQMHQVWKGHPMTTDTKGYDAEVVAWRVRERPGFDWRFVDGDPNRDPSLRGHEHQPLVPLSSLVALAAERDEILADFATTAFALRDAEAKVERMEAALEAKWWSPEIPPSIPKGHERYFIVAVRREHNGKVWTFPATYLNAYPLTFEVCECEAEHSDEGCPCTGWYSVSSEGEYDENYSPLLSPGDELVAWSEIQLHPEDARSALNLETGGGDKPA